MASASSDFLKPRNQSVKLNRPFWMNFGACQTMPGAVDWQWAALKQHKVHEEAKAMDQLEASKQVNSYGFNDAWNSFNVHSFPEEHYYWHLTPDKQQDCSQYAALMTSDDAAKANQIYVTKGSYFEPRQEWEGSVKLAKRSETSRAAPVTAFACGSVSETVHSTSTPRKMSASWRTAGSEELAALVQQKSVECLVNCDLPPPSSASASSASSSSSSSSEGTVKTTHVGKHQLSSSHHMASSAKPSSAMMNSSPTLGSQQQPCSSVSSGSWLGAELLGEALCRSQTRAREAEKVALQAFEEKEQLMHLFFREASVSFAYRQWLISLQAENLCLRMCQGGRGGRRQSPYSSKRFHAAAEFKQHSDGRKRRTSVMRCTLAFALGLMLGWGMGWIFFPL